MQTLMSIFNHIIIAQLNFSIKYLLRDKTIISADSLGKVQFWNGNFGTLISVNKSLDNKSLRNQLAYHDKEKF